MKKNTTLCDENTCFMCKNCLKEWHPAISARKINRKINKGEIIFREGDPIEGIYFVYSGKVKVYKMWDNEKELIMRFAEKGSIFGHRGIGKELRYPISASALEPSVICYVDMAFFESTLRVNTEFTFQLINFFAFELRRSEQRMRDLAHMPVKGRVADALIKLKDQFGVNESGFINIRLSRQDLASYAGATYESVFRMINELVNEKMIAVSGKDIAIIDPEALATLVYQGA
jgi:CRP-like cAMP-binding protein